MAARPSRDQSLSAVTGGELSPEEWQRLGDACRRLDHASFERLVRLTEGRLRRIIGRLVGPRKDELDDLMQETYLRAWQSVRQFRGDATLRTWLTRIAVNVALNARRDQRRTVPLSAREHERAAPSSVQEDAVRAAYEQALARLPDELRATFVLREAEGLTYREVAETLDCPIGTVMSRLHRAREQLIAELRDRLDDFCPGPRP